MNNELNNNLENTENKNKLTLNKLRLKRGGYSLGLTAIVIAAVILFNVLFGVLCDRLGLEIDMSTDKKTSVSADNQKYIKNLDEKIEITVCADKKQYAEGYMAYYAYNSFGASGNDDNDYYAQTLSIIDKYDKLSSKIDLKYIDTQSSAFTAITTNYPDEDVAYGDIIVAGESGRYRHISYNDIYTVESGDSYTYQVTANNIETALTGAIDYVVSGKNIKALVITGHSQDDYTSNFVALLKSNNYTVDTLDAKIISKISDEYDEIILAAPTNDFLDTEIDALNKFLENGGKYGKGMLYFADALLPQNPNLNVFLKSWGVVAEEGILFETNESFYIPDDPTTIGMFKANDKKAKSYCISGFNVPLTVSEDTGKNVTATALYTTSENAVKAPTGVTKDWTGYTSGDKKAYAGVIESVKTSEKGNKKSYLYTFGSIEYILSDWAQNAQLLNQDATLYAAEKSAGSDTSGIKFTAKTIKDESFVSEVTASSAVFVLVFFSIIVPLCIVAAGIAVYVKRRRMK